MKEKTLKGKSDRGGFLCCHYVDAYVRQFLD